MSVRETFRTDVWRRAHKDGVLMPLELLCLGLCGEAGEVFAETAGGIAWQDEEAVVKELGDVLWYLQAITLHPEAKFDMPEEILPSDWWYDDPYDDAQSTLICASSRVSDAVKKFKWHGKALDLELLQQEARLMLTAIYWLGEQVNATLDDIMQANIDKLNARYPGGVFVEGGGIRG